MPVLASIVLTNESARKNVQTQADNLYKISGLDSEGVVPQTNEELRINNNDSVFENYTTNEDSIEEINNQPYHSNYNDNYKGRNKNKNQYKNRRNDK